jgi:ABC-type transporter Mla MlaB component
VSLLILKGPLDPVAVDHIRRVVTGVTPEARTVRLVCTRVSTLDPVGVAGLWRLCCEARLRGLEIALVGLPARLAWRLRRHPIMEFAGLEEELFGNPLATLAPSDR